MSKLMIVSLFLSVFHPEIISCLIEMSPNANTAGVAEEVGEKENSIQKQKLEVLYDGYFYDVSEFVSRHPGGSVIRYYTEKGENATIPMQQFHWRAMPRVSAIMKSLQKRPALPEEIELSTSKLEVERHAALTEDFQKLHKELEVDGFFNSSISHVALRCTEILVWFFISVYFNVIEWNCTCAVFLGICGARAGMLQHEFIHHSMTGRCNFDNLLGSLIAGVFSGLSSSYWKGQHNRHHAMPQRLKHDVDLETMPFIAFNKRVVSNKQDGKNFFIRNQKYLFATIDTALVILYWKLWLHPRYVIRKMNLLELFFLALHVYLVFFMLKMTILQYWFASWVYATYLFLIFAMNHSHLDVTVDKLHWVEYCFVHTVDVSAHWAVDIFMSYLNYQIEHHLFPAMPQFRQRQIKDRVKALAEKHGLPYRTIGFWEGMKTVFSNLDHVTKELS